MAPSKHPFHPVTDQALGSLLDGALAEQERSELDARLLLDDEAQHRLDALQAQRAAIRELHRDVLDEPIPTTLLAAAQRSESAWQANDRWWRWGGVAASVLLAYGLGWGSHAIWPGSAAESRLAAASVAPRSFARDASIAHAVYSPEKRHPVEVGAGEQEHLVQWLSRRTGRNLKVPHLEAHGYALVGGRLLPGSAGARAQFMFEDASGSRITLYLGAVAPTKDSVNPAETAFKFSQEGPVPAFYWVDQGFGYALSGQLSKDALLALAIAVHQQL